VNSAIHYYTAEQRNADAIREARRNPVPALPPRPLDEAAPRRGGLAAALRRLTRPHALRTVLNRR
jgi:hypothetical protein